MSNRSAEPSSVVLALQLVFSLLMIVGVVVGFLYIDRHGFYMISAVPLYLLLGYLLVQGLAVFYMSVKLLFRR